MHFGIGFLDFFDVFGGLRTFNHEGGIAHILQYMIEGIVSECTAEIDSIVINAQTYVILLVESHLYAV